MHNQWYDILCTTLYVSTLVHYKTQTPSYSECAIKFKPWNQKDVTSCIVRAIALNCYLFYETDILKVEGCNITHRLYCVPP